MQMRSRSGQVPKVCVGTRLRPQSLGTGASVLAIMCMADCGTLERTCNGPVKSSCVRLGKITKPTLNSDISSSTGFEACTEFSGRGADGPREGAVHAAQRAEPAFGRDALNAVARFEQPTARQVDANALDEIGRTDVEVATKETGERARRDASLVG